MALFTIDDLRAQFKPAFANRYDVTLPSIGGMSAERLALLCDSVTLPGRNISTVEHTSGTQEKKYPYTFIEDPVSMTFLETSEMDVRKYFDTWLNAIFDTENYRVKYKEDFAADVGIKQLDRAGKLVYELKLYNAFPTAMNALELSNSGSELIRITVNFAYDRYVLI